MAKIFQGLLIAAAILLSPLLCAAEDVPAQHAETQASVLLTPVRCVALHQGQVCYQQVQISWSSARVGNYCVYIDNQTDPLQCWQEQAEGSIDYEFASAESRQVQLKNAQQQLLAQATVEVAWVYKANTRRKTHWRLF